jgi:hypothetical protein
MVNASVFGLYPDRIAVDEATATLERAGFRRSDIAVLLPENTGSKDFGHAKTSRAAERAAGGAVLGAITGAGVGWLVASGTVALPGLEPLAAVAPLVAALAAAGCGGAIGWLIGLYLGLGAPRFVARRYVGRKRRGGILLSVHCDNQDWTFRARQVLKDTGAQGMATLPEAHGDFGPSEKPDPRVIPIV